MALGPAETAEARSRAYGLFSYIALHGVTEAILEHVDAVESLGTVVSGWRSADGKLDADRAGAAHFEALSHEVFPFQSVFLSSEGMPGGDETERVQALFHRLGFDWSPTAPSADHVGVLLAAMSFCVVRKQTRGGMDGTEVAEQVRALQLQWHDEHFLRWWPALFEALVFAELPLYSQWAEAVSELVHHHRSEFSAPPADSMVVSAPQANSTVDTLDERLGVDDAGLADIAAVLLCPRASGLFLSRGALRAARRAYQLPGGFGGRRIVLTNMLKSAANYDRFEPLIEQWQARWSSALAFHRRRARQAPAAVAAAHEAWALRCETTLRGLERLREEARAAGS